MCHRDLCMQVYMRVFVCAVCSCVEESIMTFAHNTLYDLSGHAFTELTHLSIVIFNVVSVLRILRTDTENIIDPLLFWFRVCFVD